MTGTGPGYSNPCIHSGTIKSIDAITVWYNYAAASAGTIINAGDASDTTTATQSICPKGWSLPGKIEIDSIGGESPGTIAYVADFSPVIGGVYGHAAISGEASRGTWWGSTAHNGTLRYALYYNSTSLYTYNLGRRYSGFYIRCVSSS